MTAIDICLVRGGTSKGIYIERDSLAEGLDARNALVLRLFGSPDVRQIDGLGGADKLTSKVCVMGPPTRADCDIDYHFGQVGTALPTVDWSSNCGNLSSGAALYAVHKGYVPAAGDSAMVRIHQVNSGRRLLARVPVADGRPALVGDFAIGGVPGTGPKIELDFGDFGGSVLGRGLLPTGRARDRITVPGLGEIEASIVDASNLCVFVRAGDVGLDPVALVDNLQADTALITRLEALRAAASRHCGFVAGLDVEAEMKIRVNPLVFVVSSPRDYVGLNRVEVAAGGHDILSRSMSRSAFSRAHPGTGSIGTAVAAGIAGTIAAEAAGREIPLGQDYQVRIGHPSGVLQVAARLGVAGQGQPVLETAILGRTARVMLDGRAYL